MNTSHTYLPGHFRQTDADALEALMRAAPLAVLVTQGQGRMHVSHLPLHYEPQPDAPGILHGHLARANPQAQDYDPAVEAIAVFTGPDAYVSPSWYPSKRTGGKVVPTWNYAAVYAFGRLEFHDEAVVKRLVVSGLTDVHEAGRAEPWSVDDAPEEFVQAQLEAIRAFTFHIGRLEGKWKMSQNRLPADRAGVLAGLESASDARNASAAEVMRRLRTREE